jgi:hypothetical protein
MNATARVGSSKAAAKDDDPPFVSGALKRRAHDHRSLRAARDPARLAALDLLQVLGRDDVPPKRIAALARAAMNTAGLLWEAAARLDE